VEEKRRGEEGGEEERRRRGGGEDDRDRCGPYFRAAVMLRSAGAAERKHCSTVEGADHQAAATQGRAACKKRRVVRRMPAFHGSAYRKLAAKRRKACACDREEHHHLRRPPERIVVLRGKDAYVRTPAADGLIRAVGKLRSADASSVSIIRCTGSGWTMVDGALMHEPCCQVRVVGYI
jgi:hypothetical protein